MWFLALCTEGFGDRAAGLCRAANHRIHIRINDGDLDIRMGRDGLAHAGYRRAQAPVGPVCGDIRAPGFLGCFEISTEMAFIHGGAGDVVQQAAHILPVAEGEEGVAFTEGQAEGGRGLEAEHIAQEDGVGLCQQADGAELFKLGEAGFGEQGCHRLSGGDGAQACGDFRKGGEKATPHAGIGGGRTGESESELAFWVACTIENAVALGGGVCGQRGGRHLRQCTDLVCIRREEGNAVFACAAGFAGGELFGEGGAAGGSGPEEMGRGTEHVRRRTHRGGRDGR